MEIFGLLLLAIAAVVWLIILGVWMIASALAIRKWRKPAVTARTIGVIVWFAPVFFVCCVLLHGWITYITVGDIDGDFSKAMWEQRFDSAKVLLEKGADPNFSIHGYRALTIAAEAGDVELVRLLLQRGADPDVVSLTDSGKYYTALAIAREKGYSDIVRLLRNAGAKQ